MTGMKLSAAMVCTLRLFDRECEKRIDMWGAEDRAKHMAEGFPRQYDNLASFNALVARKLIERVRVWSDVYGYHATWRITEKGYAVLKEVR